MSKVNIYQKLVLSLHQEDNTLKNLLLKTEVHCNIKSHCLYIEKKSLETTVIK